MNKKINKKNRSYDTKIKIKVTVEWIIIKKMNLYKITNNRVKIASYS
jgi:hypothetical protein